MNITKRVRIWVRDVQRKPSNCGMRWFLFSDLWINNRAVVLTASKGRRK